MPRLYRSVAGQRRSHRVTVTLDEQYVQPPAALKHKALMRTLPKPQMHYTLRVMVRAEDIDPTLMAEYEAQVREVVRLMVAQTALLGKGELKATKVHRTSAKARVITIYPQE